MNSKDKALGKKFRSRLALFGENEKNLDPTRASALIFFSFVLIMLSQIAISLTPALRENLLSSLVFQVLVFGIPFYIYLKLFENKIDRSELFRRLGVNLPKFSHLFFILASALALICTSLLADMIFGGVNTTSAGTSLYGTFFVVNDGSELAPLYMILAFALIPAITEELLFRGLLESCLRRYGFLPAALSCAIFYAMIPFSPSRIPAFFIVSLVLSFVMFVTGSVFSCMIVHFIYNLYCVMLESNIASYVLASNRNTLLLLLVIPLLLLSLFVICSETARILHEYSTTRKKEPEILNASFKKTMKQTFGNLANPYFFACLGIYILYSAITFIIRKTA